MRKRFAIIAVVLAALVGAYAALGFFVAPRWLSQSLVDIAERRQLRLALKDISVNPFSLHVRLQGVALHDAAAAAPDPPFARVQEASAEFAWSSLWRGRLVVESVQLRAPWLDVARVPQFRTASAPDSTALPELTVQDAQVDDGTLVLPNLPPVTALQVAAGGVSTQQGEWGRFRVQARFAGGELHSDGKVGVHQRALRDVTLRASGTELYGVRVEQLAVEVAQLALPLQQVQLVGQIELSGGGRAAVAGNLDFPLQGTAAIELDAMPMRMLGRWLPRGLALTIVNGAASGDGRLHWHAGGGVLPDRFDGSAVIDQLRIEARDTQRLLLAWQQARAIGVQVQLAPLRVNISQIRVTSPAGRLIRQADGRINVVEALNSPDRDGGIVAAEPPQVDVHELLVEGGRLEFADYALATPFEARLESLSGSMREFSTGAGEPARLSLDGRLDSGGSVRIEGEIDIDRPRSHVDIAALVRNLRLPPWSPYAARFAGYRIAAGEMSARLDYQVEAGQLRGSNRVVFERLRLGEKIEDRGLADLPLDLAIALLSDANGCINLRIPVRGRVDNPNVALTSVLTQVLGDAILGALSAPFRSLAALFADTPGDRSAGQRGQHVGAVLFAPGSVDLSKDGQDRLARLAQTLRQRPRLGVRVDAGFSSTADQAGIRQRVVRRDIAREAGLKGPDALDWSDPKVVQAAERLYMQRVGSRAEMLRLRGQAGSYVDELQRRLAVTVDADAGNPQQLAELRAQRVQASFVDRGIAPTRIQLTTSAQAASNKGVPTTLSLTARPSRGEGDPLTRRDANPCPLPGPGFEGSNLE